MPRKKKNSSTGQKDTEQYEGNVKQQKSKSSHAINKLSINEEFAQQYEVSKRKQLLRDVPAAALEDSEESSSSSEEEDEFGELLTKKIDRQVHVTLDAIRKKDPKIYNKDVKFFDQPKESSEHESDSEQKEDSEDEPVAGWDTIAKAAQEATPKMTLKDYVRETLLKDGKLSDGEDDNQSEDKEDDDGNEIENQNGTENLLDDGVDSEDNSDDDFFVKKEKTKEEIEAERKDFETFLKTRKHSNSKQIGEDLLLHSYLENEKPDEKERFLRDFVLNNGWLDKHGEEAPGTKDYEIEIDTSKFDRDENEEEDEEDEFEDKVENFEAEYNFRFEDPDGTQIVSHARRIADSMRRPDDRRKRAREARRLRKQQEKASKTEDIKRLKNLKKKEIESRLLAIQEAAGEEVDLTGIDLEGDFDPDKYNKQMESKFGEEYYGKEDEEMKQLKKDNSVIASEKKIIPERSSELDKDVNENLNKLMDEYYNLDYEDIVGGVAMRFNYKQVDAESFNMTAEDILGMEDKELNQMVSLKYLAPYRSSRDVKKQAWKVQKKMKDKQTSQKAETEVNEEKKISKSQRKRAKKRKRNDVDNSEKLEKEKDNGENQVLKQNRTENNSNQDEGKGKQKKKSKREKKKRKMKETKDQLSSSRKEAYGISS